MNKSIKKFLSAVILLSAGLAFFACGDNNDLEKQRKNELQKLEDYMSVNYADEVPKNSGLYFMEVEEGVGDSIMQGDEVRVFYALWTLDSTLIDETSGYLEGHRYEPVRMNVLPPDQLPSTNITSVSQLKGLNEALTYMKKDGVANLVMPSEIAGGQYGALGVSGFTSVLMQVEVYKVYPLNPDDGGEE